MFPGVEDPAAPGAGAIRFHITAWGKCGRANSDHLMTAPTSAAEGVSSDNDPRSNNIGIASQHVPGEPSRVNTLNDRFTFFGINRKLPLQFL